MLLLDLRGVMYDKLLKFTNTNDIFGIDRLYGLLSSTGMISSPSQDPTLTYCIDLFEARAILLGRLGRHVLETMAAI